MKKLRKLFNLLPAFALAVISGLGVVLDNDQKTKPVMADNDYLVSERSVTNFDYTYTNNGATFHYYFDLTFYLYNVQSDSTFYFILSGRSYLGRNSVSYNNITYSNGYDDRYYTDFTLISNRFTFAGNSSDINISFYDTLVNTDFSQFTDLSSLGRGYAWFWYITQRIRINYDSNQYLLLVYPKGVASSNDASKYAIFSAFSENSNFPSVFTSSLPLSSSSVAVVSYTVDLTRSNYSLGYEDGYSAGYTDGFNAGYSSGTSSGYDNGYEVGYQAGVDSQEQVIEDAYSSGYSAGYDEGFSVDSTTATIFSGILQVGMLPINVLLAIFNFEILGINLSAFISAILTVCLTVIVIRTVTGGKNGE